MPVTQPGDALPSIPFDNSIERFGQIQKIIFQRTFKEGTTPNKLDATTADPKLIASWTPLLAATDGEKVTVSPFISEPVSEPGEARTYGGGNATLNGIEINLGKNPSPFTAKFLEIKASVMKEVKKLIGDKVSVYLVNERGRLGMISDGKADPDEYLPIPIHSLFVSDKKLGGFDEPDSHELRFVFEPNWSENFVIITPTNFDPRHDLKNPD